MPTSQESFLIIKENIQPAIIKMNDFCKNILKTRGGRVGSGMGGLLEALWGYFMNLFLVNTEFEIGWFPDNQYHDFACLLKDFEWDKNTKKGELFRIEAKSMNTGADESKAHFDVLMHELEEFDSLLILIWEWRSIDRFYNSPYIVDHFFSKAKSVVTIRDELHNARGGSFVDKNSCPDSCNPVVCIHHGEPLNKQGKRERISGPETRRPSQKVSYAANFGGLVRMLKTNNTNSRNIFRRLRASNPIIDEYITFIHRNFPREEINHFSIDELRLAANKLGIDTNNLSKEAIHTNICKIENYMNLLKEYK